LDGKEEKYIKSGTLYFVIVKKLKGPLKKERSGIKRSFQVKMNATNEEGRFSTKCHHC